MKTILCILLSAAAPAAAANLTAQGAGVYDTAGVERQSFTTSESVTLRQKVSNAVTSANPITFTFKIINPSGAAVFSHSGNSAPGTAGSAQSQLAGIPISSFYGVPGSYVFKGEAALDSETVTQTASFMISSPNITLIYPPYGARGLSDRPLVFRWTASGASRYRLTVADNAGLYNPLYSAVNSGENYQSYPENPSEPRQQLVADQVYYWRVEGLDSSNNKISESNVYNFSLKAQASSQTRNVAVSALVLAAPVSDFTAPISFKATLYNSGSVTESNISVKFSLGGIAGSDSPKTVATIAPGARTELSFTAFMPGGQDQGLAVACSDLFDDNIPDNCRTLLVAKDTGAAADTSTTAKKKLTYDEMFQAILARLGPEAAKSLEGYTFENLSCSNCTQDELYSVISALISGDAQLVGASVSGETAAAAATTADAGTAQESASAEEAESAPSETSLDLQPLAAQKPGEWTGYTEPPSEGRPATFVIRDRKEWRRVWKTLSSEDEPDVDFKAKMVVGVIAAAGDRAEAVRILGRRKTLEGIAFDYYVIEAPEGGKPPLAAYIFRLYDRSDEKTEFKRLDVKK